MTRPRISVVIPTSQRPQLLLRCLTAVLSQLRRTFHPRLARRAGDARHFVTTLPPDPATVIGSGGNGIMGARVGTRTHELIDGLRERRALPFETLRFLGDRPHILREASG